MGRFYVLLFALLIVAGTAAGFSDSRVEKTQTDLVLSNHDYVLDLINVDYAPSSLSVAEAASDFVLTHPDLGKAKTVHFDFVERIRKSYVHVIRPPPDQRLRQKSDYSKIHSSK